LDRMVDFYIQTLGFFVKRRFVFRAPLSTHPASEDESFVCRPFGIFHRARFHTWTRGQAGRVGDLGRVLGRPEDLHGVVETYEPCCIDMAASE
jgi:hypothetical protein